MLLQQIVNGFLLGGVYSIIGVGFSLVYGVMSIINLAHGSLIMIGAYVTFALFDGFGMDPFLALVFGMLATACIGYYLQRYVTNYVIKYGLSMTVVLTFGIDLVLINIALLIWSSDYRAVAPSYVGSSFVVGSVVVPYVRLAIFGASVLLTWLLYLFLNKTRLGKAVRATALNKEAAQLFGVDISSVYSLTFAIGAALAGAAGGLLSMLLTVTPFMGVPLLGKAFAVAVLGGLGNVTGAVFGGLILGVAEALGAAALGAEYQRAMGFLILLIVLCVRPQGIMGRRFFR